MDEHEPLDLATRKATSPEDKVAAMVTCSEVVFLSERDQKAYLRAFGWTSLIGVALVISICLFFYF